MHCNNRNGLHPHHIKFKSQGGKDDLHNIITVCWNCHRAIHSGFLDCIKVDGLVKFTRLRGWHP